jgi:hypothetical protein
MVSKRKEKIARVNENVDELESLFIGKRKAKW